MYKEFYLYIEDHIKKNLIEEKKRKMADMKDCENGKNTPPEEVFLEEGLSTQLAKEAQVESIELNSKRAGEYSRSITIVDTVISILLSRLVAFNRVS